MQGHNPSALETTTAVLGTAVVSLVTTPLVPALPALAASFAGGTLDANLIAQMLMAAPAVMVILGGPLSALLLKVCSIRTALLGLVSLFAVAGSAGLVLDSLALLFASRLLIGLCAGAVSTLSLALIATRYEEGVRNRLFGWTSACGSFLGMGGLLLGGLLVEALGARGPFLLYLATTVLLAMVFATRKEGTPPAGRRTQPLSDLRPLLSTYLLLLMAAAGLFFLHAKGPFLLTRVEIASASSIGLVLSLAAVISAVSAALFAPLLRWIGVPHLLRLTFLMLGCGVVLAALASSPVLLLSGFVLLSIGGGIVAPLFKTIILGKAAAAVQALAAGLILSSLYVAQFMVPLVIHGLEEIVGQGAALWMFAGALALLGVGVRGRRKGFGWRAS